MRTSTFAALAASLATAHAAAFQGFNYGATKTDGSFMFEADFEAKFKNAKALVGTNRGFTSARLYTMIQGGSSTNEPTQAIQAAINQGVSLLLGLWASAGEGDMQAEITALKSAIAQYGTAFTSLVAGISVGSEDLYRISPTGIAALSGAGANPSDLVSYISQVRAAIAGTALSGSPVGHVDTWTAWVNGSNNAVIDACDWIGMDAYPYFQNTMANDITTGKQLFNDALGATKAAVNGKPVWITETGWPVSGKVSGSAVPSTANAQTYWQEVGCPLFGNTNTWWFTQQDADPTTPNPSFGLVGSTLSTTPEYDLSCAAIATSTVATTATTASASSPVSSAPGTTSVATSPAAGGGSGTTTSPVADSSAIASLSSAATGTSPLASGGGGLSPSQGVPTVSNPSATPTGTGSAGSSGSGSGNSSSATLATSTTKVGETGTGSGSSSTTVAANAAASGLSAGSLGAAAMVIAALAAL